MSSSSSSKRRQSSGTGLPQVFRDMIDASQAKLLEACNVSDD
jgi:hypothetical protein